jgi:DNA replication initiation complex subunit (GINS family)
MATLKYDDLVADLEREYQEKGLKFVTKSGKEVLLRPINLLTDAETKVVNALLPTIVDEDTDFEKRMDAIDRVMKAAVDKKTEWDASVKDLPPTVRVRILEAWLGSDDEVGEASSSES